MNISIRTILNNIILNIKYKHKKTYDILLEVQKNKTDKEITSVLNINIGTLKRWMLLKSVPDNYKFELLKLNNIKILYHLYNYNNKDQYFTSQNTAKECVEIFKQYLIENKEDFNSYNFIEPSAGDGIFLNYLPPEKTIAFDIEPKNERIIRQDYLDWQPKNKIDKYTVFGNPPFGLRGHLALKFINKSYDYADYVCFILPQLFESDGKGSPRKRVYGYNLVYSKKVNNDFRDPNNNIIKINCIFQIWSKNHTNNNYKLEIVNNEGIKIFSLSDGGTPSSTRNKKYFDKCDIYLPSTCFGKDNMKNYDTFLDLPNKRGYGIIFPLDKEKYIDYFKKNDWKKTSFLSTNSAYNLRSSQIRKVFENIK